MGTLNPYENGPIIFKSWGILKKFPNNLRHTSFLVITWYQWTDFFSYPLRMWPFEVHGPVPGTSECRREKSLNPILYIFWAYFLISSSQLGVFPMTPKCFRTATASLHTQTILISSSSSLLATGYSFYFLYKRHCSFNVLLNRYF